MAIAPSGRQLVVGQSASRDVLEFDIDSAGNLGGVVVDKMEGGINKIGDGVRSVVGRNGRTLALGGALGGGGYMLMKNNENSEMERQARYNMLKEVGLPPNEMGLAMLRQKRGRLPPEDDIALGDLGFDEEDMMLLAQEMNDMREKEAVTSDPRKRSKR
jgi:hypothetical protein